MSADFFKAIGILPRHGRPFSRAEDLPGGGLPVIVSDELWKAAFPNRSLSGNDTLDLGGEIHTVVGVLSAGFPIKETEVFLPMQARPIHDGDNIFVFGRLKARQSRVHQANG